MMLVRVKAITVNLEQAEQVTLNPELVLIEFQSRMVHFEDPAEVAAWEWLLSGAGQRHIQERGLDFVDLLAAHKNFSDSLKKDGANGSSPAQLVERLSKGGNGHIANSTEA